MISVDIGEMQFGFMPSRGLLTQFLSCDNFKKNTLPRTRTYILSLSTLKRPLIVFHERFIGGP